MRLAWTEVTLVTSGRLRTRHQVSRLPVPKGSYRNPSPAVLILAVMVTGKRRRIFSCDNVLCRGRLATSQQSDKCLVERAQSLNTQRTRGRKAQVTHADSPNRPWKMPTINFQQYVFSALQPSEMLLKKKKKKNTFWLSNDSNKQPKRIKITVAV